MCYIISVLFVVLVIIAKKKKKDAHLETSDLNDKPANRAVCPRAAKHAAEPKGLAPSTAAPGGAAATPRPLAGDGISTTVSSKSSFLSSFLVFT